MGKKLLSAVITIFLLAGAAFAGQREGAFTLSPMLGGIAFEGDQDLKDDFAYGLGIGYNLTQALALEAFLVGADIDRESSDGGGDTDLFSYRLDALYHFMPERRLVPYAAVGIGGYNVRGDSEFLGNYGLGLLYFLTDNIALRADARHLLVADESSLDHNLLYTAGLKFQFGGAREPAAVPPAPAAAPVAKDSDGDGVTDDLDRCPDTPKGASVDENGCPRDSDGDGVFDYQDKCPDTPKRATVDATGCPLDSDGDGVVDYRDKCPDTPEGATVDTNGCPLDSDGDGILDYLDKCPGTQKGIVVDDQGCELKLTLHINFDTNRAAIKPEFKSELEKAAAFIRANSDVPYVLLSGHTDSQGSDVYNQQLSERRAEAVRLELIKNYGVDSMKIRSRGYGESRPVADNSTAEGRYQNRRVEVLCCTILPD